MGDSDVMAGLCYAASAVGATAPRTERANIGPIHCGLNDVTGFTEGMAPTLHRVPTSRTRYWSSTAIETGIAQVVS